MHLLITGILLGWGAAIPFGPINIEMIRRNLMFGFISGWALGIGATIADTTYLVLLMVGALLFLTYPIVLAVVGILGALVLAWFGLNSLLAKTQQIDRGLTRRNFLHTSISGYFMTLLNPMTIIFWSSISSQIASLALGQHHAILFAAVGVIIGTLSWSFSLNLILHFTRHKISIRMMRMLNMIGGTILLLFAMFGLLHGIIELL